MMSVTQAARYLGVDRNTIYDAIKAQRLVASQLMGKTAVRQSDLDAFRDKELRPNKLRDKGHKQDKGHITHSGK